MMVKRRRVRTVTTFAHWAPEHQAVSEDELLRLALAGQHCSGPSSRVTENRNRGQVSVGQG